MNLQELVQLQVLKRKALVAGAHPGVEALDELVESALTKQMCAKVSPQLYARLDQVCLTLELTKRQFIEWAVLEAVRDAEAAITKAFGEDE